MTANDIKVIRGAGETLTYKIETRNVSQVSYTFKPGEPLKESGNYAGLLADGDPEIAADVFVGICRKESTELAAVEGTVEIIGMNPGKTVLRGQATTTTNIDTAAKLLAYLLNYTTFDVTGLSGTNGIFTIDENQTDDPNKAGLKIIDGDILKFSLDVIPHVNVCIQGAMIGQTID